jgi:hypothetical protein
LDQEAQRIDEERARYGKETTIRPRLDRGLRPVTDAYNRACAITEEHFGCPKRATSSLSTRTARTPSTTVLLRSDFHRLTGYITITPEWDEVAGG